MNLIPKWRRQKKEDIISSVPAYSDTGDQIDSELR